MAIDGGAMYGAADMTQARPDDPDFRVLGPVEVGRGAATAPVGGTKQRALLADLILSVGTVVPTTRLIHDLWGDDPPPSGDHTVETYISRIRKILREGGWSDGLLTRPPGYVLDVDAERVDASRFDRLVEAADAATRRGDVEAARDLLGSALALWRGAALADVLEVPFAPVAAQRLENQRLAALEKRIEADLRSGRHRELVSELESLVTAHPYREPFHAQLALAQYRSGRQADALATHRRARTILVDELGIEPGQELKDLERAILRQDPDLGLRVSGPPSARAARAEAPPNPRGGRQRRRRVTVVSSVAAFVVVLALTPAVFLRGSSPMERVPANGVGVLTESGTAVASGLALSAAPAGAASSGDSVFVTSPEAHVVYRISAGTRTVGQTIPVGAGAQGIAIGFRAVWVANALDGTVSRIDLGTEEVVQTIGVGPQPVGVAVGEGAVWVTDPAAGTLTSIDPVSGRVTRSVGLPSPPFGVTVGAGSVWVTSPSDATVTRIDPATGHPIARISVGGGPTAVASGFGSIWVANSADSTISRIDPSRGVVTATVVVGDGPDALVFGSGSLWVANGLGHTVARIDPDEGRVTATVGVGNRPIALAVAGDDVWVANRASPGVEHRGGTLRVLSSFPLFSIDPAVSWGQAPPQMFPATYDTLVTYQRVEGAGGFQLVPDLALAVPVPTDGGTTWTFALRPGLRYSNGESVRPADFRYGLERALRLNPAARSYFSRLDGARSCTSRSCDLSPGIGVDDHARTVTFRLAAPDPDFLYKLTQTIAAPVAPDVPVRDVGTDPVPATGPYRIGRFVRGHELLFVRNPVFREWSSAAQPEGFPDQIDWVFGMPVSLEAKAIEAGRADWMIDPPRGVQDLKARLPSQIHVNPVLGIEYMWFNVSVPPFSDQRVRQAFSFAADRARVRAILGGSELARPTCQIIPPGMPGYRPYCPFTVDPDRSGRWVGPDLTRARELVVASGTRGMRVTVWSHAMDRPLARYASSVLQKLGFRANLRILSDARWAQVVNDSHRGVQGGVANWIVADPAPGEFFDTFFRCSSFRLGDPADTRSSVFFCDHELDRQMDEAERLRLADPARSSALWATIDRRVTDLALWVPLVSEKFPDFISTRVGNYQYNPAWGMLLDQVWVR